VENNKDACKVILVGDEFQAIYGWRGAVNAMQKFTCKSLALSQSFRYGKEIAKVAETILANGTKIVPNGDEQSVVGKVDVSNPYTVLFRTNTELIKEAVWLISEGKNVNIFADVQDFCKLLVSAVALSEGRMKDVKHDSLIAFDNWKEVKEEAKYSQGGELGRAVLIVDKGDSGHILDCLRNHVNKDDAHITLMTAHKSKGLEADQVVLAEDFVPAFKDGKYVGLADSERNLLYVACTRAKKVLQVSVVVQDLMEHRAKAALAFSTRVYGAREYLSNPMLQLPHGEQASDALMRIMDSYDDGENDDNGEDNYESREKFGEWIGSLTGVNPNSMPTADSLAMESVVLGNLL